MGKRITQVQPLDLDPGDRLVVRGKPGGRDTVKWQRDKVVLSTTGELYDLRNAITVPVEEPRP